ncbi:branched-chain amino acid ABC transporter permease [Bradyrhizobium sp. dw_411]|uniref:branched-chain amino acid ABC transporter permease n=1 Tax=Bradyrhizobium sp. dw_411 TaxID=2720082 RepID=UPI001BCC627E|nr:branched-chain amino acid ABC transporter permease [Bradyrhizobium sp. dw_411]
MTAGYSRILAVFAFIAILVTLPLWIRDTFYVNIASQILIWSIAAMGLNLLVGYAGLVSLGHASLFAIGGYAVGIAITSGFDQLTAFVIGLAIILLISAIFGALALRSTGIGFLMITLAIGQILWGVAYRWVSLTNGDNGISIPARPQPFGLDIEGPTPFYYLALAVFILALAFTSRLVLSPLGAAIRGTRDEPRRMTALGYNVWLTRYIAFVMSGFLSGIAGLLFLYYNGFVSPQVLTVQSSSEILLMVLSGGSATIFGPFVGALVIVFMKNVASSFVERWSLVLGLIFVLIIIFIPEGIVPGLARLKTGFGGARRIRAVPAPSGEAS